MAGSLIRLDRHHISVEQMKMVIGMQYPEYACSSITVSRELPAGSGFLARGDGRPGMQVGPETDQCVDREVETRDAHIPSSMWRLHYHFRRCQSAVGIAGGRAPSHRVCPI
ncbi:hypothetical protein Gotur_027227 [Gossypium turneri]